MLTEMPIPKGILSTWTPYPESATKWLISLLDLFTGIINRNENLSHIVLTETEYQQLSEVLNDLIYSVGEDEKHPLSATMTLVGFLIKSYEDQHFPKLETLFPELAEGSTVESGNKNSDVDRTLSEQIETDFVIVLFSLGCLLWKGGESEKAISAYDLAIRINPNYADIHAGRGEAKFDLNDFTGAKVDFQKALQLVREQGKEELSVTIEERLQELNDTTCAS